MIYAALESLIAYAEEKGLCCECDRYVIRNRLIELLQLNEWQDAVPAYNGEKVDDLLTPIVEYAIKQGIIEDTANCKDLFDTALMGIFTPMPREVARDFVENYEKSPKIATDAYYAMSRNVNYVRAGRMEKDMKWTYNTEYGTLDITVNLSKPEKDPRDIAAAKKQKSASYPKCPLCPENAGFAGNLTKAARQNLRPIPLEIKDEVWQLQYSPYGYYNEHCILFNCEHTPMVMDRSTFEKLISATDILPHYFFGSNAELPIVGGSILSHEHFQGGRYTFAMDRAPVETLFRLSDFPNVDAGIVKWPMSVIRLSSKNKEELCSACEYILDSWRRYTDADSFIFAETDGVPHNTVTPILRKERELYVFDLVLRNNITTDDRPLGVFHPNPDLHHIKKENIGLIEVMGLAVLPSRLKKELEELKEYMLSENTPCPDSLKHHEPWAKDILERRQDFTRGNADAILKEEVGEVFLSVLCDSGVFKRNSEGRAAFVKFIRHLQRKNT